MRTCLLLLFAIAIALVARTAAAAPGDDAGCGATGTALYFGNGVMTTYDQAQETADDDLPGLAAQASVTDVVELGVAYNHTDGFLADIIQTLEQKEAEDSRFGWFLLNNVTSDLLRGLNALGILKLPTGAPALIATLQKVINAGIVDSVHQMGTFYDADVADQVSGYEEDLHAGYRVIVVAHSQGNLYANASHAALASDSTLLPAFGIVGVADPAEASFNGYVTSDADLVINALRTLGKTVLPANVHLPTNLDDFTGHLFEPTYVNAQLPARARVVALLSSVATGVPYPPTAGAPCGGPDASSPPDAATGPRTCMFDGSGGPSALLSGTVVHGVKQTYSLQVAAGDGVIVRETDVGATAFVPAFNVTDPTGALVVNGASGADVASSEFTAQMTGTYTVAVYDASNVTNLTGAYNLYWTVAPGADACGALTPGGVVSNQLDEGALDSYTFSAQAGEGFVLRVADVSAGALVPAFNVYDPTGAILINGTSGADVASSELAAPKSGTYTVVVYDVSPGYAASGPYNLYFTLAPGANKGGALTPGAEVSSQLDEGALDSYTFSAQAGEGFVLRVADVSAGALVPAFNVYDPTGAILINGTSGADVASSELAAPKSGTYTVVVYDVSPGYAASGPYNLYFTLAPGANKGGALTPGAEVSSQLDEGALDSYTFSAQAGEGFVLRVADVSAGALVPAFNVYDPTGAILINGTSGADVASSELAAPKSGTYTVVVYDVSPGYAASGPYNLYFTLAPGANEDGSLGAGGSASGQLDEGALDSYTFTPQATDKVTVQVTDVNGGTLVPAFNVYDPTGAIVVNGASGADVANAGFTAQVTGTYTLVIYDASSGYSATGPYDLTVTVTPPAN